MSPEERRAVREQEKEERKEKSKGLLNRMRDLFRKKD